MGGKNFAWAVKKIVHTDKGGGSPKSKIRKTKGIVVEGEQSTTTTRREKIANRIKGSQTGKGAADRGDSGGDWVIWPGEQRRQRKVLQMEVFIWIKKGQAFLEEKKRISEKMGAWVKKRSKRIVDWWGGARLGQASSKKRKKKRVRGGKVKEEIKGRLHKGGNFSRKDEGKKKVEELGQHSDWGFLKRGIFSSESASATRAASRAGV